MKLRFVIGAIGPVVLTACSSFNVVTPPEEGSVVVLPARTSVSVEGNPRMSGLQVTVDGNDVSNQMTAISANRSAGELTLPVGRHELGVAADVDCWYCAGGKYRPQQRRTVCVVPSSPSGAASKTPLAKADNQSWSGRSDRSVSIAADAGSVATRWIFRSGGLGSNIGLLESSEFPCLCLRSMQDPQNSPVGMAICDTTDGRQVWRSARMQLSGGKGFYRIENTGLGLGDACLTEGADGKLVQRACNDADNQLWAVRNNATSIFETEIHPWGQ